ncbi:hypothetical protein ONZ43_g543 [Nemania bipapillata]|uniref:Uncharacterized protein n=1 Tax=Nemania bipapillata TaxID=110536 RepID=A0ACC2J8A5_9PEZI|nr:hypothetical protein ONZ43_g543 [Nemania bipapillata]
MSNSSSAGDPSKFPNANNPMPAPNLGGAPPSSPGSTSESHGFARPPPGFDPNQGAGPFDAAQARDLSNAANGVGESIEDEIARKIAELEQARQGPVTDEEKERIAKRIRSIREGGWLEGLKLQLIGQNSVPIEYFNRLAAEHESTIATVARINATADRKVAEKDALIDRLTREGGGSPQRALVSENTDLKDRLGECENDKTELQDRLKKLQDKLDRRVEEDQSKPQANTDVDVALAECNKRTNDLQMQLDSTKQTLDTSRQTASNYYNEVQALRQQKIEANSREQANKDDIRRLREENKGLRDALASSQNGSTDLQKRISDLEAKRANCDAKVAALEKENKRLKDAAALQGEPADLEDLRKRIQALEAELTKRDDTITALKAQPAQAPNDTLQEPTAQLQARCKDLRDQRDMYRDKWARRVVEGRAPLREFWQTVDNTKQEINRLYVGIEKLCRAFGITEGVLDIPEVLDRLIKQVNGSVNDAMDSPLITIVNLRTANALAQIQIETLQRQLDRAQLGRSEDEIRAELRLVDEQEVERRVSLRTQAYRQHRGTLLTHIFDAQVEFLRLAEKNADRDGIETLVDRFLQPTSLPMIQLPVNRTRLY